MQTLITNPKSLTASVVLTSITVCALFLSAGQSLAQTDRCTFPYVQMAGAGSPGNLPTDPTQGELTIQHINVGEPFTNCTNNSVTLVMKVNNLDPGNTGQAVLPENAEWKFNFTVTTPDNVDHEIFVAMDTFVANNATSAFPNLSYGRRDPTPTGFQESMECFEQAASGVEIFHCANLADGTVPSFSINKDGTITIKLNFSVPLSFTAAQAPATGAAFSWDGSAVGTKLKNVRGSTILLAGVFLETVQTTGTTGPTYTRGGNISCGPLPLAVLSSSPSPASGPIPLSVTFSGSSSSDPNPCTTLNSYSLNFGDGSPVVTQGSSSFAAHNYNNAGTYSASLTVGNTAGQVSTNPAQITVTATSAVSPPLASVVSRKNHVGTDFSINLPLIGTRGVECRSGGATGDYTLVFTFVNNLINAAGIGATVTSGVGSVASTAPGPGANQYTVNVTGVISQQYVTVTLSNVQDSLGNSGAVAGPQMGVLVGDVNASGVVNTGDTNLCKAQALQTVTNANFRNDINASAVINTGDVNIIKQNALSQLPTPP